MKKSVALGPYYAAIELAMSRIAQAFEKARQENRAAFVAYLCAGDPDFDTSLEACRSMLRNGADVLELGVPFSDPLADGMVNQLAAQRALESGMNRDKVFELVRRLRSEFPQAAIVFYTYYNLVFCNGVDAYIRDAAAAGLDGILTLDLPPEEAGVQLEACKAHGLDSIFIVAPTTSAHRLPVIAKAATGFIYYVSREGVTGVRDQMATGIAESLARIRQHTTLPVVVGFGISRREHVKAISAYADGVVVGSALVNVIAGNLNCRSEIAEKIGAVARDLTAGLTR